MIRFNWKTDATVLLIFSFLPSFCEDLQMICGFSCEDLISMFKELKSLGVVVKELSNELRQLVSNPELSSPIALIIKTFGKSLIWRRLHRQKWIKSLF